MAIGFPYTFPFVLTGNEMYSNLALQTIVDRIAWKAPFDSTEIILSSANLTGYSGRSFDTFHEIVTVENIKDTIRNTDISNDDFNTVLYDLKRQGVLKVFNQVFDENERAYFSENYLGIRSDISGTDYSDLIIRRKQVFDNAYGLQVAINVLEIQKTTSRSNLNERAMKEFLNIQYELDGYFNGEGVLISKGLYAKRNDAIQKVIDILFPKAAGKPPYIRDKSYMH